MGLKSKCIFDLNFRDQYDLIRAKTPMKMVATNLVILARSVQSLHIQEYMFKSVNFFLK